MAANIDKMFYYGEKPWHGLGTELDHPATAREAISASGLDYEVVRVPVEAVMDDGERVEIPGRIATVRVDTKAPLGILTPRYQVVQNAEAFGFMDALAGQDIEYHTAGSLGKGENVWLLAKLPGEIKVGKEDVVQKFLCLHNAHDGTAPLRCWWTPIRVVCQNTLSAALGGSASGISIRHTGDLSTKFDEAQRVLGLAQVAYDDLEGAINKLMGIQVSNEQVMAYFQALVPDNQEAKSHTRTKNVRDTMTAAFEDADGIKDIRGTAWAAYNAAVEVIDHSRTIQEKPPTQIQRSRRLHSIWFGSKALQKRQALDLALSLA